MTGTAAAASSLRTALGFAMMCLGMFMAILDIQIVATSLPEIAAGLKASPDAMSWVQTAYLTAEVIAIPLTGVLTRIFTMRWLFVLALTGFTLASIGCAFSDRFETLVAFRVVQGFAGGTLIPAVFSAVFLLFAEHRQGVATTAAGVLAVLAPTLGPVAGGWITQTFSWRWLFLVNVLPGIVAAVGTGLLLARERGEPGAVRRLDWLALLLMAAALAALEVALKEAPRRGWVSPLAGGLLAASALAAAAFAWRTLRAAHPLVHLRTLRRRNFAVGSILSFVLGMGLFGSVYLMPVFLALVRGHSALEIGEIVLVTGAAQLLTAPIAVALERRVDARILAAGGFLVFSIGLGLSAFQTPATDFRAMFWPQLIRGSAVMFCILPPTRLALGRMESSRVADASGLFNLMRNLGGAVGLALIDTVVFGRAPVEAARITARLKAGDEATARLLGLPMGMFRTSVATGSLPPGAEAYLAPLVKNLALTRAVNEAWAMAAVLTLLALATLPFARPSKGPVPIPPV